MSRLSLAVILALSLPVDTAAACRRYAIWHYRFPQRCEVSVAQRDVLSPPKAKPAPVDIPLPSLEGMEFPSDCDADWCQRLRGIGLLRQLRKTN